MQTSPVLLLLLAACGGSNDAGRNSAAVTRDSAGIAILEFPAGAIEDAPEWTLSKEPLAIIGDDSPDATLDLTTATLGGILSDGRVVVATAQPAQVMLFGADGAQVGTLGRAGEGPGEYRALIQLLILPGDTVLAFEVTRRKGILYGADGTLLGELDFPLLADRPIVPLMRGRLDDGSFVLSGETLLPQTPEGNEKIYRLDLPIFALGSAATNYDTVTVTRGTQSYRSSLTFGNQVMPISRQVGFGPSPQIAVTRNGFWLSTGDVAELHEFVVSGATFPAQPSRVVRYNQPRREVTEADRERYRERAAEGLERLKGLIPAELLDVEIAKLKETVFANTFPAIGQLRADHLGRLWMTSGTQLGDDMTTWTVLDPDGKPIGRVTLPEGTIFAVADDRVVVRREDPASGLVRLEVWGVVVSR